jgi:hypothetical protein
MNPLILIESGLLLLVTISTRGAVILQDDFTGVPGTAIGSQWDTQTLASDTAPTSTMIDSSGTEAQIGIVQGGALAPTYSHNGSAWALGGGPGVYGYKPTASHDAKMTVNWGWKFDGTYNSSNDAGYSSWDGKPVDLMGYINFGLTDQVSGSATWGSGEILVRTSQSSNDYFVQVVSSNGAGIAWYDTGIANTNGHCGAGQWIIDWSTVKAVISFNGSVVVDTSIKTPFYNTFPGGTVVLPTAAMAPHFEVWGGGSALVENVKWESVGDSNCTELITGGYGLASDLNSDCFVDFQDLNIFVSEWLQCNDPQDPNCEVNW